MDPKIKSLLDLARDDKLSQEESDELRQQLREKYLTRSSEPDYLDYNCPKCDKPLILAYMLGPVCMASHNGCGYTLNKKLVHDSFRK